MSPANIAMRDYQESVTMGQTHRQTDAGQSDPYVPLLLHRQNKKAGDKNKQIRNAIIWKPHQSYF